MIKNLVGYRSGENGSSLLTALHRCKLPLRLTVRFHSLFWIKVGNLTYAVNGLGSNKNPIVINIYKILSYDRQSSYANNISEAQIQ